MKTLDPSVQAAVDSQERSTPYRILVEVTAGGTTYRWATASLTFDPGGGSQTYEGRIVQIGQVNGLIFDGVKSSAGKRTFDFTIADSDGHVFAKKATGFFTGSAVVVREIFDGISAQGREHHFVVDRVGTDGRGKMRFECSDRTPLSTDVNVGLEIVAGDFATAEDGVVGTAVPMVYGSKKIHLPLISAEDGTFLIGYGNYNINNLYQNGTKIYDGSNLLGFSGFTITTGNNPKIAVLKFNDPSQIRGLSNIFPLVAEVTRLGSYQGAGGQVGDGFAANNPINVFTDLWLLAGGSLSDLDAASFNAAGSSFVSDSIVFNCALKGKISASNALKNLLLSCGSRLVITDKVYFYRFDSPPQNPLSFDPTNILRGSDGIGTTLTRVDVTADSIHNKGEISFEKWDKLSDDKDAKPETWKAEYEDQNSISDIGAHERSETSMFIGDWSVADRAIQALIRQEVANLRSFTFETTLQAMSVDEGDQTQITFPDFGLSATQVLVTRVQRLSNRRVQLTVRELAPVFWSDPGPEPTQNPSNDPAKADPSAPSWPTTPVVQTTRVEADGTVLQDLAITWTAVTHPLLSEYEVWMGIDAAVSVDANNDPTDPDQFFTSLVGTTLILEGAQAGKTYYIRVRARTGNGKISPLSSEVTFSVSKKGAVAEGVQGSPSATYTDTGIEFVWGDPSPGFNDFDTFELAFSDGSGGYNVIRRTKDSHKAIPYAVIRDALPAGETVRNGTLYIRVKDTSGNSSAWTSLSFSNSYPSAPTIQTPTVGFVSIFLDSTPSIPSDVVRREWEWAPDVSGSPDWNNAKAFSSLRRTSAVFTGEDATIYWFRCRDIDWLSDILGDQDSSPWSASVSATTYAITSSGVQMDALANLTTKNLLRNAGFETWATSSNPDFWRVLNGATLTQVTSPSGDVFDGNSSVLVSLPSSNAVAMDQYFAGGSSSRDIEDVAGKDVTLSVWYKAPSTDASDSVLFYIYADGVSGPGASSPWLVTPTSTWTRMYATWTVPANATAVRVLVYPNRNSHASGAGTSVLVDDIQLQIGDKVTKWEPHDLDFITSSGGISETEIQDDAISTPKLRANSVVAKHILVGQLGARQIFAAADRVSYNGHVFKCATTHGPGAPGSYDQNNHTPVVGSNTAYWTDEGTTSSDGNPTSYYPSYATGIVYFSGTILADQIMAQGAILNSAHIGSLNADKVSITGGTLTGPDGSYWDVNGIHMAGNSSIDWDSVNVTGNTKPEDNATNGADWNINISGIPNLPIDNSLLAYWPFDNKNLFDYTGSGNDLTAAGSVGYVGSVIGNGLKRVDNYYYVSSPSSELSTAIRSGDFYISFWWTPYVELDWADVFSVYDGSILLRFEHGNDNATNSGYWFGTSSSDRVNHDAFIQYGNSVHVVASINRSGSKVAVYINGILDQERSASVPVLGVLSYIRFFANALNGEIIDDFRIYSGIPDQSIVNALYNIRVASHYDYNADVTANSSFVNVTYPADQQNLQNQIDGKVESWFQSTDPSAGWSASEKPKHAGDMWWNTSTNKLKRYDGSTWSADLTDQTAIDAYSNAANAQATADSKVVVFTSTPTVPYDIGDLWDAGGTPRVLKRSTVARTTGSFNASDWIIIANEITSTSQVTDDAGLGTTAIWASVTGSGRPADYADVTSQNTSNDTSSVSGISSSIVRKSIGDSFSNGFESFEFSEWTAPTDATITAYTSDKFSGAQCGKIDVTTSRSDSQDASGSTGGIHISIPEEIALSFGGKTIRISAYVKSLGSATKCLLSYSTADVGNSTWKEFTGISSTSWTKVELYYDVPVPGAGGIDYVGIWGDVAGSILFDRIIVSVAPVDYITSTKITSITVESPNISGNTGSISGTLSIGGSLTIGSLSSTNGITINSTGIYHTDADDFTGGNANSKFGISTSGNAYFKGEVDSSGSYGRVRLNGASSYLFEIYKSGNLIVDTPYTGDTALVLNSSQYAANGLTVYGKINSLSDTVNVTAATTSHFGITVSNSKGSALQAVSSVNGLQRVIYSYHSYGGSALEASNSNSVYSGNSSILAENRSSVSDSSPPISVKTSGNYPHLRLQAGSYYDGNPNTVITGKWGDVMLCKETNKNYAHLYLCQGTGPNGSPGGPGTYGTYWRRMNSIDV